ncbi:MAG: hypothetical protein ACP5NC_08430 [Nitrososphaeria archaeon]
MIAKKMFKELLIQLGFDIMIEESEANFQGVLANEIRKLTQSKRFSGIEISDVKEAFPIHPVGFSPRFADIVCFESSKTPFLLIETKKEDGRNRSIPLQPLDQGVVGQALAYAYLYSQKWE